MQIAQFRYDFKVGRWSVYWSDRNSRWQVDGPRAGDLLAEVDGDPTGIFDWA